MWIRLWLANFQEYYFHTIVANLDSTTFTEKQIYIYYYFYVNNSNLALWKPWPVEAQLFISCQKFAMGDYRQEIWHSASWPPVLKTEQKQLTLISSAGASFSPYLCGARKEFNKTQLHGKSTVPWQHVASFHLKLRNQLQGYLIFCIPWQLIKASSHAWLSFADEELMPLYPITYYHLFVAFNFNVSQCKTWS